MFYFFFIESITRYYLRALILHTRKKDDIKNWQVTYTDKVFGSKYFLYFPMYDKSRQKNSPMTGRVCIFGVVTGRNIQISKLIEGVGILVLWRISKIMTFQLLTNLSNARLCWIPLTLFTSKNYKNLFLPPSITLLCEAFGQGILFCNTISSFVTQT